jgi:aspartyl-tRNA(Asn)/glutamyl-tRNA(Gln) amidotransferase subunit B
MENQYELVIGLEVHAQLATQSKMFCGDATLFGAEPNTQVSAISLAHPGTLPVPNKAAIEMAIRMGLACKCQINRLNFFDRKNYFYPDLPKGYQITQDKAAICLGGRIVIWAKDGSKKSIRLNRIHMEEDAGKSIHLEGRPFSQIDLNRAGMPLIEIVTEPEIRHAEDAALVLMEIRKLVRFLGICDGNMEEGSFRCDANVSIRKNGEEKLGKKVEIKNMNSFRFVQKAIEFEFVRQCHLQDAGEEILSETRMFNPQTGQTYGMRAKETLNDYRYFPDPDLQPIEVNETWLQQLESSMPPLPEALFEKYTSEWGLPMQDALILSETLQFAMFFEALCKEKILPKTASNWMLGPIKSWQNETGVEISEFPVSTSKLSRLIALVGEGKLSFSNASQQVFPGLIQNPEKEALTLAQELNLIQNSDEGELKALVLSVLEGMPEKVKEYKNGKKGLLGLFMGEVKKASHGQADPRMARKLIEEALSN